MTVSKLPVTPAQVETELFRFAHMLDAKTEELAQRLMDEARSLHEYKVSYAKAVLEAEGTVLEREAHALLAVSEKFHDKLVLEALADACLENVRSLRDQIRALQSVCANVRSQAGLDL